MAILINKDTEKYTLENIYTVSISEADMRYAIKPAVLLNYMQDLAAKSIDRLGHEYCWDELYKKGRGWFLIRYRIEFDDYPVGMEKILIKTESRGCHRLNAYRDFEGFDISSGKRLFRATSCWFIVELDTKSVINIKQEYPEFFDYKRREDDLILQKLRTIESFDRQKLFHVRYDDLDINGHVNNTVYISWAMEGLDYNFRSSHKLKTLDIYFKHEVKYGDDIISLVKMDEENQVSEHLIKNASTGDEVCLLRCSYVAI